LANCVSLLGAGLLFAMLGISILLRMVVTFIQEFVDRQCVLEKKGIFGSIASGWAMVRTNLRRIVVLCLIMVLIMVAIWVAQDMVFGTFVVPIGVATELVIPDPTLASVAGMSVLGCLYLPWRFGVEPLVTVFHFNVWTLAYLALQKRTEGTSNTAASGGSSKPN